MQKFTRQSKWKTCTFYHAKLLAFKKSVIFSVQLNGNFLQYMGIVSAIPKDLIDDARRYHIDKTSILSECSFQLSVDLSLHFLKNERKKLLLAFD